MTVMPSPCTSPHDRFRAAARRDMNCDVTFLSAAADTSGQDSHSCGWVLIPPKDDTPYRTRFPSAPTSMTGRDFIKADKACLSKGQFDATKATKMLIAACPAAQGAVLQRSLVFSTIVPPGLDDMGSEVSMIVRTTANRGPTSPAKDPV